MPFAIRFYFIFNFSAGNAEQKSRNDESSAGIFSFRKSQLFNFLWSFHCVSIFYVHKLFPTFYVPCLHSFSSARLVTFLLAVSLTNWFIVCHPIRHVHWWTCVSSSVFASIWQVPLFSFIFVDIQGILLFHMRTLFFGSKRFGSWDQIDEISLYLHFMKWQ